ncbi:MAG: nuclear transport factor 2 family protein [Burkholderiales bacterium]
MQRLHATAEAAERAFYAAMADGDLDRMMALWADDDAAVCNHPGGPRLIGREAIRASFREIFSGGGVRVSVTGVHAWRSADVAVHSLIERIAVEGRAGTETVEVVATNVFVRATGGWRILVHHAGVSDTAELVEDVDEEDEEDDGLPSWLGSRFAIERPVADADDDDGDGEVGRPPHGRLH